MELDKQMEQMEQYIGQRVLVAAEAVIQGVQEMVETAISQVVVAVVVALDSVLRVLVALVDRVIVLFTLGKKEVFHATNKVSV